jgi:4-hydroxybenzoate polyprenyltransferase
MTVFTHFSVFCRMVKIEHSIFALPFAYSGAFLAARAWPEPRTFVLLTLAMVGVRSFAMGVNRLADLPYDRKNPRTAAWPLVTGEITLRRARFFCGVMALLFVLACAGLNTVCLTLAPFALLLAALYSFTKRFTWACHFVLGAVIGLAPVAGWLSVSPEFSLPPLLLGLGVLFWIAGFDILYACQDKNFDQSQGLHSLPVRFGLHGAMLISAFSHVNTVLFLLLTGFSRDLSFGWHAAILAAGGLLWWEQRLISPDDLRNIRLVFALNGPVSLLLLLGALAGVFA